MTELADIVTNPVFWLLVCWLVGTLIVWKWGQLAFSISAVFVFFVEILIGVAGHYIFGWWT